MRHEVWTIINATPDSFFEGSRAQSDSQVAQRALEAMAEGASTLDIGGMSTRPGFQDVDPLIEKERLVGAILAIKRVLPEARISIDTFRSEVVESLYETFGKFTVNDISGGQADKNMFETVARLDLPYVMMSQDPTIDTMLDFFEKNIQKAERAGIQDIILDPGFGFGKSLEQNFQVLAGMNRLKQFGLPILVGISRKGMIWRTLGLDPGQALNGTTALHFELLGQGADILRVHDTKPAWETIKLYETYITANM